MRNNKGQFVEGNAGRPKGSKNRSTIEIRQRFQDLLDNNIDQLQQDLNELEPKDRINAILNLSQYVLPKLSTTTLRDETIEIDFSD